MNRSDSSDHEDRLSRIRASTVFNDRRTQRRTENRGAPAPENRLDRQAGSGHFLVPGVAGRVAVGVDYDTRSGRLWVAGGPTGRVSAYDASTGALLADYAFSAPVGFINDLVVTRDAVYATDSNVQQLLVIPLGAGGELPAPSAAFKLALNGDITYAAGFNANGNVAGRNRLILVQSNTGRLVSVDPRTRAASEL